MLRRRSEMKAATVENCHEGIGCVDVTGVLTNGDGDCGIVLMHDDILQPGTVIGEHPHDEFEEVYYIVNGQGTLILDGVELPVQAGDVSLCQSGHSHGIKNDSESPMRLIVIGLQKTAR